MPQRMPGNSFSRDSGEDGATDADDSFGLDTTTSTCLQLLSSSFGSIEVTRYICMTIVFISRSPHRREYAWTPAKEELLPILLAACFLCVDD